MIKTQSAMEEFVLVLKKEQMKLGDPGKGRNVFRRERKVPPDLV